MRPKSFLFAWLIVHASLSYGIVFLAMIFEGEIVLFAVSFLAREQYFQWPLLIASVFSGLMVGAAFWYWLGRKLHGTFLHRIAEKVAKPFDEHLLKRTWHSILVSKFTYGVHHFLLVRAGMLKIPFGKYMKDNLLANLIWMPIVGALGYFAGASYEAIKHSFKFVEIGLLIMLVIFLLVWKHFVSEKFKKEI